MVATVPEPVRPEAARDAAPRSGFLQEARSAFEIRGFPAVLLLFVTVTVGVMIVNSMLPFYLESGLRLPAAQQPLVLGLLFGTAIIAFPLWTWASARMGKRTVLTLGLLLLTGFTLALVWGSPDRGLSGYLLTFVILAGASLSAVLLLPWAMLTRRGRVRRACRRPPARRADLRPVYLRAEDGGLGRRVRQCHRRQRLRLPSGYGRAGAHHGGGHRAHGGPGRRCGVRAGGGEPGATPSPGAPTSGFASCWRSGSPPTPADPLPGRPRRLPLGRDILD